MINRVVLVGRLTKDPELRYTPSGIPMARFTLAVNRTFGEREADFIGCLAWRKQAENLANFMKKGSLIGVEGRIQTGSFEGQDGKRVYTTDIVADAIQFLEVKRDGRQAPEPPSENNFNTPNTSNQMTPEQQASYSYEQRLNEYQQQQQQNQSSETPSNLEDDLPF